MDRIEKLINFLKDNPGDSFLKHALALEHVKNGNDADAEKMFREVLQNEPNYVGSYYHLGKLFERKEAWQQAIEIYAKGMDIAKAIKDNHAYNELKGAWEELSEP